MRFVYLLVVVFFQTSAAQADSYRFSIADTNPGKIILAKNCLDYTFCGGKMSEISGNKVDGFKLDALIELTDAEFKIAQATCDFKAMDAKVVITNLTKNTEIPAVAGNDALHRDFLAKNPTVYLPELSEVEQHFKYNRVKALIDANDRLGAIQLAISEFGISTGGYELKFGGNMGSAGAVTDHEAKTVTIADVTFLSPCLLIQTMRHELEHVAQMAQVGRCEARGKNHNLDDHIARERSAYLNDIRSIPEFCPVASITKAIVDFETDYFTRAYYPAPKSAVNTQPIAVSTVGTQSSP